MVPGYPGYRASRMLDPGAPPCRPPGLDAPRHVARIGVAVRAAVAAREDGRPGRARQRRAAGAVRRAVAADALADRRLDRAPRAPRPPPDRLIAHSLGRLGSKSTQTVAADTCTLPSRWRGTLGRLTRELHGNGVRGRGPRRARERRPPPPRGSHSASSARRRVTWSNGAPKRSASWGSPSSREAANSRAGRSNARANAAASTGQ